MNTGTEASDSFACFGSRCAALVIGDGEHRSAAGAVAYARARLLEWHRRFSRFEPDSELTRLNQDPRPRVPVSDVMARFAGVAVEAARRSGGLVDATLVGELERAGYGSDRGEPSGAARPLAAAPTRRPAGPHPAARWRTIDVDRARGTVARPSGVRLDSGGLVKGLLADLLAEQLSDHECFAVDCAGDLRLGGAARRPRSVRVADPFHDGVLHELELAAGGVATSGIAKRSWTGPGGAPAHHLLDPATGRPAFTGLVQVTALAPTALEAEVAAKAALLSGPDGAERWLRHGGVIVADDGSHEVVAPRAGPLAAS